LVLTFLILNGQHHKYKMTTNIEQQAKHYFPIQNLGVFIQKTTGFILIIASIISFAYLVWGGIQWIMSEGDKTKYEAARNKITFSIIGLGITALAWILWNITIHFLGIGVITNGHLIFHF